MSIVGSLFRMVAPGVVDNLEAQGLFRGSSRVMPSLVPEMFIGREGITNLGEAGIANTDTAMKLLDDAERDWFNIPAEEWMKKYPSQAIAYDPVARKAMLEISDKNVDLRSGVDLNKIPANEVLTFDEIFKADVLKKAYPDIEDVTVSFIDDPRSSRLAAYAPKENMILFNRQHPDWQKEDTPVRVALHEIQHYVQGKELFTKGESFTTVLDQNESFVQPQQSLAKLIGEAVNSGEVNRFAKEQVGFDSDTLSGVIGSMASKDGLSARRAAEKAFREEGKSPAQAKALTDKFIAQAQKYPSLEALLNTKNQASQAYNQSVADYMKVAGEVFARQTEQRRGMSGLERLATPAMREIETDPQNRIAGITLDNMTAPRAAREQDSYFIPEWELKERTIQEKKEFPDGSRKLKNPVRLEDGSRLSGFTSNSQNVFYGYDKNGEIFSIGKEYVRPEQIVGSRDSDKTANKIRTRLTEMRQSETFTDPFTMQVPQSTIPEGM